MVATPSKIVGMFPLVFVLFVFLYNACGTSLIHNPLHNVSTPEFRSLAKSTYEKVIPCLEGAWMLTEKPKRNWSFPDDAKEHYEKLLKATEPYRKAPVHEYAGYEGPWVENLFIQKFMHIPLHRFNGLIPIFIQFIDSQILRGRHFDYIHAELQALLRPNVIYLAISQGDVGLGKIGTSLPNILVLSAGGYGHVPIPLVKGEIMETPVPSQYSQDIAFFGTVRQASRPQMLEEINKVANSVGLSFKTGSGPTWKDDMQQTKFNLAPRGYGRSSFRFAESIQMGRIPAFLYDDHPWVPYRGTNIDIDTYGFIGGKTASMDNLTELVHEMANITQDEYNIKLHQLDAVRYYFTYAGIMHQINEFLQDPFGPNGGYLRCTVHPKTERCCG